VVVDTETTGLRGSDRACDIALVRFERGKQVAAIDSLINPLMRIPTEASDIHHITDAMVEHSPTMSEFFGRADVKELIAGAQPCAYSAQFDRRYVPLDAFGDPEWPWLDPKPIVEHVDKFAKGKGRYKLTMACARHGIPLSDTDAHRALPDAIAAGRLLYVIAPKAPFGKSIGDLLAFCERTRANRWAEFHDWLGKQPPMPEQGAST
jgi:DNA polymerase III epsilon subunit-like protein